MDSQTKRPSFKKVLVIDDDEVDVYLTRRILEESGFAEEIVTAFSTDEALSYLRNNKDEDDLPGFIFLDLNMPAKTGLDFLNEFSDFLKGEKPCPVSLLMNVVNTENEETKKAKEHPLIRYVIEKPLTKEKLMKIED